MQVAARWLLAWIVLPLLVPEAAWSQSPDGPEEIPGATFRTAPAAGDPLDIVLRYVRDELPGRATALRGGETHTADDFRDLQTKDRFVSQHNGVTHLHLRQQVHGLPVYHANLEAHVARDGSIIALHNRTARIPAGVPPANPVLTAAECLHQAATDLALTASGPLSDLNLGTSETEARFSDSQISLDPIPAKLLYFPHDDGSLRLAWNFILRLPDRRRWLDLNVDASTGRILSQANWIHEAASYRVAGLPLEAPEEGARTLVSGVEDTLASPFGWHDTDGVDGAEFTDTRGNNVVAQTDPDGNDSVGFRPDGGTGLTFDFAADFSQPPDFNQAASVTSLFFLTNVCHDIFYRYGFDEAAGNFQTNNYDRGGSGGDAIVADAQDGLISNNASFATPPDGIPPRMDMGLVFRAALEITSPTAIAGFPPTIPAAFGPAIAGTISGTVVQGTDDTTNGPSPTDCCGALNNSPSVNGNIALIDRGDCDFVVKVKNAQNAGAIAVIMVNNQGDDLVTMSGTDPAITIPSIFIGQSDGQLIKDALSQGVQVRIEGAEIPDTSFDATIVVHEFAHGLTVRLTGGPSTAVGLDGLIPGGMGEGWSDFFAHSLTAKISDTRNTPRLIGQYSLNPAGIRTFPYSSDLGINPLTYDDVRTRTSVHRVGEIWAVALWEVYWNLVEAHGFDPDLYSGTGGNNLAIQLVIDGCKLQPSSPTFLQARDAILQADLVNNGGIHHFSIWQAFAKRGLGLSATAGVNTEDNQVTAAFDVPASLDTADPAADGVPNLIKAAFHMNLIHPTRENLPQPAAAEVGGSFYRAIRFKQLVGGIGTPGIDYHVNGILYEVEVSDDLLAWEKGPEFVEVVSITPDPDGVTETVIVRGLQSHPFFRVRVTRTTTP